MCPVHTHTLPVNPYGFDEEGSCRRVLDNMSIICRQVLTGRVGKGSNETARGIEEKENVRKSKAQVSNGRPKQCMLLKFYHSHPLGKLSPGRRQLRGCDSGWGFCCDSE
jgi:hypothetical protein